MMYELCRRELHIPGWRLFCILYKSHTSTDVPHEFRVIEYAVSQAESFGRVVPTTADMSVPS